MKGIKKVKTAVIGCGAISRTYFENMTNVLEILEVARYCDLNRQLAEDMAVVYNISVLTMKEIPEDSGIEIVVNLTNPAAYHRVIRSLLEHGKHVYTEEVLAATFSQTQKLIALTHEKGRLLYSTPDAFLGAAIQTAGYLVESGMIGIVTFCVTVLQRDARLLVEKSPYTSRPGGDIGIDVGTYYTTAMVSILGEVKGVCGMSGVCMPEQSHYFVKSESPRETYAQESETYLAGLLRFKNGCVGILHFNSRSIRTEKPYVIFYGTEGVLFLEDPDFFGGDVKTILKGQTEPVTSPYTHGYDSDDRGLGVAEMAWAPRKGRVLRARANITLHSLEVPTGVTGSGHTKHSYEMQTRFEEQPVLPRGYLGETCTVNRPEGALALQEMSCRVRSEDERYPPSSGSSFWAL